MTAAFTATYGFPVTNLSMDMSAAPVPNSPVAEIKVGWGTRIPNLRALLAMLKARQATGHTASKVREGDPPLVAGDEPARMAVIFAPEGDQKPLPQGATGAFNAGVAARLTMGDDGESGVYSGA